MTETSPSKAEKGPSGLRDPHHPNGHAGTGFQTAQRFSGRGSQGAVGAGGQRGALKNQSSRVAAGAKAAKGDSNDGHSHLSPLDTDAGAAPDPLTIGEMITLQEAADYAGLDKTSLPNYIRRGRLKAKKFGKMWVTTRAAVDEYLESRSIENIPKKYRNQD